MPGVLDTIAGYIWGGGGEGQAAAMAPLTEAEGRDLPVVPHYDYAVLSEHVYGDGTSRPLPKGWRVFLHCEALNLNREGYEGVAYMHAEKRHVVIAQRGTIDAAGLRAGIWVYFDEPTVQFSLAEQFSKAVRLKLNLHSPDEHFTISYTGHSLGGVLATCRAVAEQTFGVVFETPGCKSFVEKVMHPFRYDEADVITYLRPPNTINTLKPQVGFVIQLPPCDYVPVAKAEAEENVQRKIAQMLPTQLSIPKNMAEFVGKKLLERSVPELYSYLSQMEPVVRELFDQTQQVHSIHNIVPLFEDERGYCSEPGNSEVVSLWPNHIMQFFEFHSTRKNLDDCRTDEPHLRTAYEALLAKIYSTRKRNRFEIPHTWLSAEARKLISWWTLLPPRQRASAALPLSTLDRRVLSSCWPGRDCVKCRGLTAFQLKQYLFVVAHRPAVQDMLSRISVPKDVDLVNSKL
eukprot:TRINITY_DN3973_c0_g1_i1.p1 TRINITY_DN3973_c0_g1~~TRINITY_DN3973_c0_g1_i1.p1  ORF type:complete len:460 (+),score=163.90 TRINITY_DN3973_c0_g1_i1:98-1477(+)